MPHSDQSNIAPGTRVRFATGPLGLVRKPDQEKFDGDVQAGDEGDVIGPHPYIEAPGWILVAVGDDLICPCHVSHVEEV